ncbi:MAG: hypothetical protein OEZ29_00170 [Candidatus Bathyarchaeota archaeon]|nr:hypothetical protein [Candidatus Bathyarchaeota archaeon]MDH5778993.1 hypothetical protein [Candidatus Bathyarchaeota archaeon]
MKWKNVRRLISVDIKSGRLVRGQKLRKYQERRVLQYVMYGGGCLLGIAIGLLVGTVYNGIADPDSKATLLLGVKSLFISAPTLVFTYNLIFTMLRQIQRAGIKASIQPPYWLPITWGEHTLAAILANLIGIQLAALISIVLAISVVSIFLGEISLAALTILALLAIAFLASVTTEIFRVLQVRLTGAVYRTSGKAAIWVRFFGSILLFIAFYAVYFSFTSGANFRAIIEAFASGQKTVWFIPYLWPGMTIFSFVNGQIVDAIIFSLGSAAFLSAMFAVAVGLNRRFGLYEPPAIRISIGTYAPKPSVWERLGFSLLEAAIMRKDFKAFTRRRELMFFFVLPIVIIIMYVIPLTRTPYVPALSIFSALFLLAPGALMATVMGSMIIGQEGTPVWHLYSSPLTAKSLVKCKCTFVVIFSCVVTLVCSTIGILLIRPSPRIIIAALVESIFLIISLSVVSLRAGIKGASFVEIPRPRMIRPAASIINFIVCVVLASVILAPLIPYAGTTIGLLHPLPQLYLYIALAISGALAAIVTYGFYKIAVRNATDFLAKAEM